MAIIGSDILWNIPSKPAPLGIRLQALPQAPSANTSPRLHGQVVRFTIFSTSSLAPRTPRAPSITAAYSSTTHTQRSRSSPRYSGLRRRSRVVLHSTSLSTPPPRARSVHPARRPWKSPTRPRPRPVSASPHLPRRVQASLSETSPPASAVPCGSAVPPRTPPPSITTASRSTSKAIPPPDKCSSGPQR